ncbi:Hypothetical protein NTJ_05235 [Nesidiocoris tenuis]|uniref:Uncharacterized protein n=1 Tax=Nesidiocoris tenuis TaxID=355587 RepID=A0ABN7AJK1_9HEMI|nr:Hypothetical protein NTJ_05235 [Nesidiocoris tenuis]
MPSEDLAPSKFLGVSLDYRLDWTNHRPLKEVFLTSFPSEDAQGQAEQGLAGGGLLCLFTEHNGLWNFMMGSLRRRRDCFWGTGIRVIVDLGFRDNCRKEFVRPNSTGRKCRVMGWRMLASCH